MATGTYISIITLNVNGLNAPMHQKAQTGWMDIKTRPIYVLSARNPLQTSRHINWKWEDGKIYSMQMGSKRKLE